MTATRVSIRSAADTGVTESAFWAMFTMSFSLLRGNECRQRRGFRIDSGWRRRLLVIGAKLDGTGQGVARGRSVDCPHGDLVHRRRDLAPNLPEAQAQEPTDCPPPRLGKSPHTEHQRNGVGEIHLCLRPHQREREP